MATAKANSTGRLDQVEKVRKLLEVTADLHGKLGDTLNEIDELLGGGAGIAASMKQLEAAFDGAWSARYASGHGGRYVWSYKKDKPQIKRLLKLLGLEEACRRAVAYLQTEDPFIVRARHPFGLFVSTINSYTAAADGRGYDAAPPTGCLHAPPCRSDQEHTKRLMAEARS